MSKKKKYNDTEEWFSLIPELKEWNNGKGIDHEYWIEIEGRIEYALAYTSIFWPKFILFRNCIFIDYMNDEIFERWHKNCNGSLEALEATVNHRHLEDWFGGESTKRQMEYMGRTLKDIWETKLNKQFPGRQVIVELFEVNEEYKITVYQKNH
ncbi:hypothetical protein [Clostridium drakei]|uniref:Uncharacterized protein n=1 Tax=Clostridium drakei TaxID=332101 RepID=A0A2U8DSC6_9CLOT|nr:hypothetical protein [Clostridium drakei]AWI05538.1 hypothetical protein B9W14_13845 [Clostridium drakei]